MIGRTVSHYEVVALLGGGGMGEVYEARDTVLQRSVALKVLRGDRGSDPDSRRRFLREARAASALNHPGIITIHDVVSDGDSDVIVMERVEGEPLEKRIPEGGLPIDTALDWSIQIADALAAAHQAGVVHRDLKPGNVMIAKEGRVKVLDFGLAKFDLAPDSEAPTMTEVAPLTRAGTVFGTLAYMAPEQALGQPADARSDVFSFGAILYEMLTGQRAFSGANEPSLLYAVVHGEPRPAVEIRPALPAALGRLVDTAMAKTPQDRHPSMVEVAADLRSITAGAPPVHTAAPQAAASAAEAGKPPAARTGTRSRARTLRTAAAGLAVAAAVSLFVLGREPLGRWLGGAGGEAAAPRTELETLEPFELQQRAAALLERYDKQGNVEQAIDLLQRAAARQPDYAPAYAGLAAAYWRKHRLERDPLWLERALSTAQHAIELDGHLTAARAARGLARVDRGELEAAREDLEEVLRLDPDNAVAYRGLAELAEKEGDTAAAERLYARALELAPESWELYSLRGYIEYITGRYESAEASFRRSLELTPDNFIAHTRLAGALHMQGLYGDAAQALQSALAIRADPDVYTNLGTLYFFQGLFQQSADAFERAVELGANDSMRWANLGDAYREIPGRSERADAAYQRAIQLLDQALGEAPEDVIGLSRRALYRAKRGDFDQAIAELDRLQGSPRLDAATLYRLALAYEIAGRRERALEVLGRALAAGYSLREIKGEPDLAALRSDARYHQLVLPYEGENAP